MDLLGAIQKLSTFGSDIDAQRALAQYQKAAAQQSMADMDRNAGFWGGYSPAAGKVIQADPATFTSLMGGTPPNAPAAPQEKGLPTSLMPIAGLQASGGAQPSLTNAAYRPQGPMSSQAGDTQAEAVPDYIQTGMKLAAIYPPYRDTIMKTIATRQQLGGAWDGLSAAERYAAVNDPAKFAESQLKNRSESMSLVDPANPSKMVTVSRADWMANPGKYPGYVEADRFNPQTAVTSAETARHNRVEEGLAGKDVKTDMFGNPMVVDKNTGKVLNAPAAPGGQPGGQMAQVPTDPATGEPLRGAAFVSALPPQIRNTVQSMLDARLPVPSSFALKTPYWQTMLNYAQQADPTFDATKWPERLKLSTEYGSTSDRTAGGKINSAKKIIAHATDLLGAAVNLDNDSMLGNLGNTVENAGVAHFGQGQSKTALNNFKGYTEGLGGEFEKLMGGGSSADAAKKRIGEVLNQNDPMAGTIGGVGAVIDMMEQQVQPLADQYNNVMGTSYPLEHFLGPDASARLVTMKKLLADAQAGKQVDRTAVQTALAGLKTKGGAAPESNAAPIDVGQSVNVNGAKVTRVN